MAISTLRQITKSNTSTKIIEFNDNLQANDFGESSGVQRSTVHSKFSRIELTIIDFTKGKKEKAVVCQYNLSPDFVKVITTLIKNGDVAEFEKPFPALNITGIGEQKINFYKKDENGLSPVSKFVIKYQGQMKSPWTITIENGKGKAGETAIGGTNIERGTYVKENDATVYLSKIEMLKMANALDSYISNFENWAFKAMIEKRVAIEREAYESSKKASQA